MSLIQVCRQEGEVCVWCGLVGWWAKRNENEYLSSLDRASFSSPDSLTIMKRASSDQCVWGMFVSFRLGRPLCWLCLRLCRWSLNGTLIDLRSDYRRRLSGGSLIISSLDRDQDTGIYQCTAYNTWGTIHSQKASLQFACKWHLQNKPD